MHRPDAGDRTSRGGGDGAAAVGEGIVGGAARPGDGDAAMPRPPPLPPRPFPADDVRALVRQVETLAATWTAVTQASADTLTALANAAIKGGCGGRSLALEALLSICALYKLPCATAWAFELPRRRPISHCVARARGVRVVSSQALQ